MTSQHSKTLGEVLDDVAPFDLHATDVALRATVHRHPVDSTCDCPIMNALVVLYDLGYRVVKP